MHVETFNKSKKKSLRIGGKIFLSTDRFFFAARIYAPELFQLFVSEFRAIFIVNMSHYCHNLGKMNLKNSPLIQL